MLNKRKLLLGLLLLVAVMLRADWAFAPGNCGVFTTYTSNQVLTASSLNSSFTQAAVTNSTPQCLDDYSTDNVQMRSVVDPYPGATESRPTALSGELERLRYVIAQITGTAYWYQDPDPLVPPGDLQLGVPSTRTGNLTFYHASSGFRTRFLAANATASADYRWPTAAPSASGQSLTSTTAGVMSWTSLPSVLDRDVIEQEVVSDAGPTTVYSFTVTGGTLSTNRQIRLVAIGDHLNNDGAGRTLTVEALYGGTVVGTWSLAVGNSATRRPLNLQLFLSAANATNAQRASMLTVVGNADGITGAASTGDQAAVISNHASLAIDSTANQTLALRVTHANANATLSTIIRTVQVVVE